VYPNKVLKIFVTIYNDDKYLFRDILLWAHQEFSKVTF
jgi:hypothetical protein